VTQHPLESTVGDFWQMVWDHNSQTVVVLSDASDDDFAVFWPLKQQDVEFENFRVRFIEERQVALPDLDAGPGAAPLKDEHVTQIEVAAQSLQVQVLSSPFLLGFLAWWRCPPPRVDCPKTS